MSRIGEIEELLARAEAENRRLAAENEKLRRLVKGQAEQIGDRLKTDREDEQLWRMMRDRSPLKDGVRKVVPIFGRET